MATTSLTPTQTFSWPSFGANVSNPFNLPTISASISPVISVTAVYSVTNSVVATGIITITESTDSGNTFNPFTPVADSPASLAANGTMAFVPKPNALYRFERADGSGGITMVASALICGQISGSAIATGDTLPFSMPLHAGSSLPVFYAWAGFYGGAIGTVTVTASTDGGQTFSPVTENGAALPVLASNTQGVMNVFQQPGTIYRLEFNITSRGGGGAGGVNYIVDGCAITSWLNPITLAGVSMQSSEYGIFRAASVSQGLITAAQVQKLYDTLRVPLTDAAISGALTAYKSCTYGAVAGDGSYTPVGTAIVKLSIPAAAQRARQRHAVIGLDRQIRAEYADVVSVVDEGGNSLAAGYSVVDPPKAGYAGTKYVPGQRTISANLTPFNPSTGNLTDVANTSGIQCFATLIEAAVCGPQFSKAGENHQPGLTALAA